ncbi:MAG: hypothetical protein A2Z88_10630 [Omnitrophica WOR_2 bacterium GWA2_47_8]|nr:MAG: hypothetical protein A2Z88_10630 [Omnitrophica WOR_2 bacterium GWA2_47_8]
MWYLRKIVKLERDTDEYLIQGWSKQYRRPVSLAEVREINANLSAFVDVMERMEHYLKQKRRQKNRSES